MRVLYCFLSPYSWPEPISIDSFVKSEKLAGKTNKNGVKLVKKFTYKHTLEKSLY